MSLVVILAVGLLAPMNTASAKPIATKSSAAGFKPNAGPVFNVPRSRPKVQFRIERRVVPAIHHARKGSRIDMTMFSFDRMVVADALIKAHRRGVNVRVIVNDHETPRAQRKLRRVLGTNDRRRSWFKHCTGGPCRDNRNNQHTKMILFEHSGTARKTVMFGSANMKLNAHKNQYNDLYIRNGVPKLYNFLLGIFKEMARDKKPGRPFRERWIGHEFKAYVLPFYGNLWRKDPIRKELANVKCRNAGTGSGRTVIRISMHAWNDHRGVRIAKRLRNLYGKGCDVKVLYGMARKEVRNALAKRTKRGVIPVRSMGWDTNGDGTINLYTHLKAITVRGHIGKRRNAFKVITGSANFSRAGRVGDELLVKVRNSGMHKAYRGHWRWMWRNKARKVRWTVSREVNSQGTVVLEPTFADPLSDNSMHLAERQG